MALPTKQQVVEKAKEMWHNDRAKMGDPSFDIEPELSELRENGYLSAAQSDLMRNAESKHAEWKDNTESLETFNVDTKQLFDNGCLILGSKHTGKTDVAMLICDKALNKNAIVVVFDPSQDWQKRSSIMRYMNVRPSSALPISSESAIYDLSMLSPHEQQRVVENFAGRLFEYQASSSTRRQYVIIFEEAHTYFSQGCMRSHNMTNTVRLLSVGRNVGIAVVLISQFASMLDKFAVKHCNSQSWFGFTREPNDLRYLRQFLGSNVEELPKLQDGEFLFLTRNSLSKISIESYQGDTIKTEIKSIPQIQIPQKPKETSFAPLINLAFWTIITAILIKMVI